MKKMATVEVKDCSEFFEWTADKKDPNRFRLLYFKVQNMFMMQPTISTPRMETVIFREVGDSDLLEVKKEFKGVMKIFECYRIVPQLGLIEVENLEQFRELTKTIKDWQKRYKLIYTEIEEKLILRPVVSTRRQITVVLPKAAPDVLQAIAEDPLFQKTRIWKCLRYILDEEQALPKAEEAV